MKLRIGGNRVECHRYPCRKDVKLAGSLYKFRGRYLASDWSRRGGRKEGGEEGERKGEDDNEDKGFEGCSQVTVAGFACYE